MVEKLFAPGPNAVLYVLVEGVPKRAGVAVSATMEWLGCSRLTYASLRWENSGIRSKSIVTCGLTLTSASRLSSAACT